MRCHACQFENLPGLSDCARCASPLALDAVAIAPPRAAAFNVRTRVRRAWHRMGGTMPNFGVVARWIQRVEQAPVPWSAVARSIVPGLGQLHVGARTAGRILLGAWGALLLLSAVAVGSGWGALCFYLSVSVHTGAFLLLFGDNTSFARPVMRLIFGLAIFFLVYTLLYRPVFWAVAQVIQVQTLNAVAAGPVLDDSDVLLVTGEWMQSSALRRGDLILYDLRARSDAGYVVRDGRGVDRVVGLPGDIVTVTAGVVHVNGRPAPPGECPLDILSPKLNGVWRPGSSQYVVFPTRLSLYNGIMNSAAFSAAMHPLAFIADTDVVGRVLWRIRPWSRFGRVE